MVNSSAPQPRLKVAGEWFFCANCISLTQIKTRKLKFCWCIYLDMDDYLEKSQTIAQPSLGRNNM